MKSYKELLTWARQSDTDTLLERARLNALFENIGEGVIATDQEGKINRINEAALKMLGLTRKKALGKWYPKVIVAADEQGTPLPYEDRLVSRSIMSGETEYETTYYKTHDKLLPVAVTVSPIIMNGYPIGAIEVFRDITREHEVDRMKSEFISIASHQLRTPLTAINTYARMLAGDYAGKLNKGQKEFMKTILNSVDRMNELITALLDISRIESGKLQVNLASVDCNKLIESIVIDLRQDAKQKGVDVQLKLPEQKLKIKADKLLLQEVYSNMVSNALKYTPSGGNITVELKDRPKDILLAVRDTGYGIPKDSQDRIFTKFYRAQNVLQKDSSGSGLGLYLVKLIADTMGGKVWFKTAENEGSTFYFSLPKKTL